MVFGRCPAPCRYTNVMNVGEPTRCSPRACMALRFSAAHHSLPPFMFRADTPLRLRHKAAHRLLKALRQPLQNERGGDALILLEHDDAGAPDAGFGGELVLAHPRTLPRLAKEIREFGDESFCRIGGQGRRKYVLTGAPGMSVSGHVRARIRRGSRN